MTAMDQRLKDAQRIGYLVVTQARSEMRLSNAWFDWTEAHRQPFIRVVKRVKYAEVTADHIAVPKATEAQCQRHRELVERFAAHGSYVFLGPVFMGASKIPVEHANDYAHELYTLLTT